MKGAPLDQVVDASQLGEHRALPGVPVARPRDLEQCRELFALARRDRARLSLLGFGSKLGRCRAAAPPDFALSTRELSGVTDFVPGDGTLTALAGTPMEELQRVAREAGLSVTPDVARPETATLGGTFAAGVSGADRLRYGPARRHLLGVRALKLDGAEIRSGGKLVKNVTGYDLHRLFTGSCGSLVLLTELSLRLFPNPAATAVASVDADDLETALERASAVGGAGVGPRAVTVETGGSGTGFALHVVLAGLAEHLELELERLGQVLDDPRLTRDAEAEALRDRLRDLEPDGLSRPVLELGVTPSRLRLALGELLDALGPHAGARLLIQPAIARVEIAHELGSEEEQLDLLGRLRSAIGPLGAQLRLRAAGPLPLEAAGGVDPLRRRLEERLRATFDPDGLLCTLPPAGGLR